MALLEAVVQPGFSLRQQPVTGQRGLPPLQAVLKRFQPGALAAVLRTWARRLFAVALDTRAPSAVFSHFRWLQERLQV